MSWRVAKSLEMLLKQVNQAAPNRSKASDGGVGDAAHASKTSDHNPWVKDSKGVGVVTARDFTHDPARGFDCEAFTRALVHSRDPRIKYIIWNKRIIMPIWAWKPYSGANPHTHHAHVSIKSSPNLYDSEQPWVFTLPLPMGTASPILDMPVLKRGSKGDSVRKLQALLGIIADGSFGPVTEDAVRSFQKQQGLVADGIVGVYTWDRLLP